jgi:hypothetical protein
LIRIIKFFSDEKCGSFSIFFGSFKFLIAMNNYLIGAGGRAATVGRLGKALDF